VAVDPDPQKSRPAGHRCAVLSSVCYCRVFATVSFNARSRQSISRSDSVKIFLDRDTKKPIYAPYREHVPPDVAACLRWLMVRRPDEWRERQDHTHRFIDNKRTAAELFAELQAEAAEPGIKLIASDDGTFEPVEAAKRNGKTED
jgi:hypothetical protein